MCARKEQFTQNIAAAKSGMSERTGRNIEQGKRSKDLKPRPWRTRKDPLEEVWETKLVPMLKLTPDLLPITLLEYLQGHYQGQYPDSVLRTLQRRIKQWQALYGPKKEVMFRQHHEPGRQSLSDFTQLKGITISIAGQPLKHLLYHFRLAYSGFSHIKVILGGESYTALAEGLQEALWRLGGATKEHRTDSLSAAFKNLNKEEQEDITQRYEALCHHYQMKATRNNRGKGHENGSIESPHGHIKRRIKQALLLRNSYDFESVETYQRWLDTIVNQHNQRNAKNITLERPYLQALPMHKTIDFTEVCARVSSSATIDVRRATYSVDSRLMGERLRIHLYHDRLECYLGAIHVATLGRVYPIGKTQRARNIDYRHLIHSLVKKPQAFRYSRLRNDLLPNDKYKVIWRFVDEHMSGKSACKFIVGLLYLAAKYDCEGSLAQTVLANIEQGRPLSLTVLEQPYRKQGQAMPKVSVIQHELSSYNFLLNQNKQEVCHG